MRSLETIKAETATAKADRISHLVRMGKSAGEISRILAHGNELVRGHAFQPLANRWDSLPHMEAERAEAAWEGEGGACLAGDVSSASSIPTLA